MEARVGAEKILFMGFSVEAITLVWASIGILNTLDDMGDLDALAFRVTIFILFEGGQVHGVGGRESLFLP
jgi:hypothetical protein